MEYLFLFAIVIAILVFWGWKEKNKKEQESQMYGPQANVYIPEGYELKKKKNSNGSLF